MLYALGVARWSRHGYVFNRGIRRFDSCRLLHSNVYCM